MSLTRAPAARKASNTTSKAAGRDHPEVVARHGVEEQQRDADAAGLRGTTGVREISKLAKLANYAKRFFTKINFENFWRAVLALSRFELKNPIEDKMGNCRIPKYVFFFLQ